MESKPDRVLAHDDRVQGDSRTTTNPGSVSTRNARALPRDAETGTVITLPVVYSSRGEIRARFPRIHDARYARGNARVRLRHAAEHSIEMRAKRTRGAFAGARSVSFAKADSPHRTAREWRPGSELNRRTRLCRPLHNHSATWPVTGRARPADVLKKQNLG